MKKLLLLATMLLPLCASAQEKYKDTTLSAEERAQDLLGRLTLEEKLSLMISLSPGIPRLDIPKYYHGNEALHGIVRPGRFTVFPQAIGLAATWDPELLHDISSAISDEARARWNSLEYGAAQQDRYSDLLTFWSPTINAARDPRWGRTPETYGEDPFLTSRMGVAFVSGLQGDYPEHPLKVVSTPKHFAANNEEHNRAECNAIIPERSLREYYFPAFEACVREAHAQSIMSAYNAINGIPCSINTRLLRDILRGEWGFDGYVVSDCGAPWQVYSHHHYVDDPVEASRLCIEAGLDLECGDNIYERHIVKALEQGKVIEPQIDSAVYKLLRARMRLGLFDPIGDGPYDHLTESVIGSEEHQELALQAARESIVLLKNDGILPLKARKLHRIAVLGKNADTCIFGDYSGSPVIEPVSILDGIRRHIGDKSEIIHVPWGEDGAIEAARGSDVVIAVMGTDTDVEMETRDRRYISLAPDQEQFLRDIYAVNPRTVLVLVAGSSMAIPWEAASLPAILDVWYPGESGGTAAAEVLFGDYNPAGRLPLTFFASQDDLPAFDDYDVTHGRTYMYFQGDPLYSFGHGLSYSRFKYKSLKIKRSDDGIDISLRIRNRGRREGDEVVQIYLVRPDGVSTPAPAKELKAFKRVHLRGRRSARVHLRIPTEQLRCWDEMAGRYVYPAEGWTVLAGASSSDIRLTGKF